jgi:oxygen-independent coproporphyrinogen-3 oxidase
MGLGVYVHVPFCVKRCHYCDFVSYDQVSAEDKEQYLEAVLRELDLYIQDMPLGLADSLYLGGGTPTCLTGGQLSFLLEGLRERLDWSKHLELTVEANPGTMDAKVLRVLKELGVNRLSLGVQSFDPAMLRLLGRLHTAEQVYETVWQARHMGFDNVSIDLMYNLPGQSLEDWGAGLDKLAALELKHLSLYELNLEPGTLLNFWHDRGLLPVTDPDRGYEQYAMAMDRLAEAGWTHYEISNFARAGYESRHNLLYWRQEPYLGLGAGASGYLNGIRYTNENRLSRYARMVHAREKPRAYQEAVTREMAMRETMFLGLRLRSGVHKDRFLAMHGRTVESVYAPVIAELRGLGLLEAHETHYALSRQGLFFANDVILRFF